MQEIHDQTTRDLLGDAALSLTPSVLRNLKDCVMLLNDEGRITHLSRGSVSSLDAGDEDTLIGRLWRQIWPENAQDALAEAVTRGFGGHITQYWTTYEHADGTVSEWDIRLTPVHDAARDVKSVVAVSRNLTGH